jgi:MFS transporter, ACS family, tartrate transporter
MIPYVMGAVVMIRVSRSSDRNLERRYHAAIPVMLGWIGLLLMGIFHSPVAIFALLSLLAIGAYGWWLLSLHCLANS